MIPLPFFKLIEFESPLALEIACQELQSIEKYELVFYKVRYIPVGLKVKIVCQNDLGQFGLILRPNLYITMGLQGQLKKIDATHTQVFARIALPILEFSGLVFILIVALIWATDLSLTLFQSNTTAFVNDRAVALFGVFLILTVAIVYIRYHFTVYYDLLGRLYVALDRPDWEGKS